MKEFHVKEPLYTFFYNIKKMSEFCEGLQTKNSHTEIVYTFCIQKLYKIYTTDVYKMHTQCMQNVYHIPRKTFVYNFYTKLKDY